MACWHLSSLKAAKDACALSDVMGASRVAMPLSGVAALSGTDRFRAGSGGLSENYLLNLSDIG
jgi:hypothetical protein